MFKNILKPKSIVFMKQNVLYTKIYINFLRPIAHNVPAVYDVLPARIRALRSKVQGWQNVAEFWRGNERSD
jgi:hypothetical protein